MKTRMVTTCIKDGGRGTSRSWSTEGPTKETQQQANDFKQKCCSAWAHVCMHVGVCMCTRSCMPTPARWLVCTRALKLGTLVAASQRPISKTGFSDG